MDKARTYNNHERAKNGQQIPDTLLEWEMVHIYKTKANQKTVVPIDQYG